MQKKVERENMPEKGNKKSDFLYLNIYKELKSEILQGKYEKGDSFPPERLLKDRFGTTHVTIRNALSLLVEEGYIERYSGKGTIVVYAGTSVAASESAKKSDKKHASSVRIVLPLIDSSNEEVLDIISRECKSKKIDLSISLYHEDPALENSLVKKTLAREGVLLIYEPSLQGVAKNLYASITKRVLLLNPSETDSEFTEIHHNLVRAAYDTVLFMNRLGYDDIAFVDWERTYRGENLHEGYSQGLKSLNLPLHSSLRVNGMGLREGGADACRRILNHHPSCRAFLCANDLSAGGVQNYLEETGLESGKDFTIIGCGNHAFAEVIGLSSMDLNNSRTGQIVRTILTEYCDEGQLSLSHYEVKPELVLRKYSLNT
jgi:GntR family transcriptional regulator, arabinose operon transcriptional repressor